MPTPLSPLSRWLLAADARHPILASFLCGALLWLLAALFVYAVYVFMA